MEQQAGKGRRDGVTKWVILLIVAFVLVVGDVWLRLSLPVRQDFGQGKVRSLLETTNVWKTYTNPRGYSFEYPPNWGVGAKCDNEDQVDSVKIGPGLLIDPYAYCGTANIPPTAGFYIDESSPSWASNSGMDKKKLRVGPSDVDYFVGPLDYGGYLPAGGVAVSIPFRGYYIIGECHYEVGNSAYSTKQDCDRLFKSFRVL